MMEPLRKFWAAFRCSVRTTPEALAQDSTVIESPEPPAPANDDEPPPSSMSLTGLTAAPIETTLRAEIRCRCKGLSMPELLDVIRFMDTVLASRDAGPSPLVMMQILDKLDQTYTHSATTAGMVIPVLRAHMHDIPRASFDRALLELERRGRVELVEGDPRGRFVEPLEAIDVHGRGLLYYLRPKGRQ